MKKILSIDGGDIRGLIPAMMLAEIEKRTGLAVASDDMDDATNGNVENLKAEAGKLIQTHKTGIGMVCAFLQEGRAV